MGVEIHLSRARFTRDMDVHTMERIAKSLAERYVTMDLDNKWARGGLAGNLGG